jgi:kinetochore protein Fta7
MKDSIDLLKTEIAKEEALLDREKKSLQEMDKNAKRAEAERKRQMQKVCNELSLRDSLTNMMLEGTPSPAPPG